MASSSTSGTLLNPITSPVVPVVTLQPSSGTVLTVGAGMEFATLGAACSVAVAGDTIAVEAGTYVNDFATVSVALHIVAVGGIVNEVATVPPPDDKGLITDDAALSIQGFTFTGGSDGSPDGNVCGIRYEGGGNLSVSYCHFYDMQEGLLGGPDPTATVTIDHCEFNNNGTGDGMTHNLYIGSVAKLVITNSYFHDANIGHEIKSRAAETIISNNVIADGPTGTASYDIDIPNAGVADITGNVIEKGPDAANTPAIHYGGETQYAYTNNSLTISGNTILNDLPESQGIAVYNEDTVNGLNVVAKITGNSFYNFSPSRLVLGAGTLRGNTTLSSEPGYSTASPWLDPPVVQIGSGPEVLNLSTTSHVVTGGAALLKLTDTGGSSTITGGAGGIDVTATAGWDQISTQAGATDTINLPGRSSVVQSAGHDHINASGTYEVVDATGPATIAGGGFNEYGLDGAGETLTTTCSSILAIGSAGRAHVIDNGGDLTLTVSAGGSLTAIDNAQLANGRGQSTAAISGGAVTGTIANAGTISLNAGAGAHIVAGLGSVSVVCGAGPETVTAGSGTDNFALGSGADRVVFGSASTSVSGGTGSDTYVFTAGGDGTDTISGFKQGTDKLIFNGFTGQAISSGTITGGNTQLTLTDGTEILLTGVALPGYPAASSPTGGSQTSGSQVGGAPVNTPPASASPSPLAGSGGVVLNTGGHAVDGNASSPLTVSDPAGGNTIAGGLAGLDANVFDGDLLSTYAGATDEIVMASGDTLIGAGCDQVTANSGNTISEAAASTITLLAGGNTVLGGAGLISVTDETGGDSIAGGSGGLDAALAGTFNSVTTASNAADTVSIAGYSTLLSRGTDQLSVDGMYNAVSVTGAANITLGQGYSNLDLMGNDTLSAAGTGQATVEAGATAVVSAAASANLSVTVLAGGTLAMTDSLGGGMASFTVGGGAANVSAATGMYAGLYATVGGGTSLVAGTGNLTLTSGSSPGGLPDSITAGTGNITLTGGSGCDDFTGGSGTANLTLGSGADTVSLGSGAMSVWGGSDVSYDISSASSGSLTIMNWGGDDRFVGASGTAPVFTQDQVIGGSTYLTTTGGEQIELVGITNFT